MVEPSRIGSEKTAAPNGASHRAVSGDVKDVGSCDRQAFTAPRQRCRASTLPHLEASQTRLAERELSEPQSRLRV